MLRAWQTVAFNTLSSPAKLCKYIIIVTNISIVIVIIIMQGHAFEARLYAESVANNFLPATGTVRRWQVPANSSFFDNSSTVRIDSGVSEGDAVSTPTSLCIVSSILKVKVHTLPETIKPDPAEEEHVLNMCCMIE